MEIYFRFSVYFKEGTPYVSDLSNVDLNYCIENARQNDVHINVKLDEPKDESYLIALLAGFLKKHDYCSNWISPNDPFWTKDNRIKRIAYLVT
ncbi:MAG: hypothetical protein K6E73_11870 [Bacteroidales bacterium]|nr:hypothetical protein [Bacteroidales bacterium]